MKFSNPLTPKRMTKVHKALVLPWGDKWLVLEALCLLAVMRLAIKLIPFRRLAQWMGPLQEETPQEITPGALSTAERVGLAVRRVSPYTPWTSNCFPQALAAKWMLWRRGVPSTLYLGASFKDDRSGLAAHAWLRAGPVYVTGGRGHERFATVGIFGSPVQRSK